MLNRIVLTLILALSLQRASAQVVFGSIQGTITDESGAVVPNVKVVARNADTGLTTSTQTNAAGIYLLGELRPGNYQVEAEATGFSKAVHTGIRVRVEDRVRVDIAMRVGQVTEAVEVIAQAPLVQSESTTIGKVVEENTIKQLPLSGRGAFGLAMLSPGVMKTGSDEQPRLSGGRARTGEFSLDGTSVTDPRRGETAYSPNLDAIQEFKVQTNGLSAEFGRLAGGIVNATLKSGTNQFHGNIFEFLRNDNLNARNYFSSVVPKQAYNQFGGIFGGPIRRNKTFFFMDYEGIRVRAESLFNLTIPLPAYKTGDFSSLLGPTIGTDALGRSVARNQIYDPTTLRTAPNGRLVRDPYPGNIIPTSRFDPAGAKVLALYPTPNQPGTVANFRTLKTSGSNGDKFDVRIDHQFSERDLFFARISDDIQQSFTARPYESSASGGQKGQDNYYLTSAIGWTRMITPATINDFRFASFRGRLTRNLTNTDTTALGIPNVDRLNLPRFEVPGYDFIGDSQIFDPTQEQYQFQNITTFVRGRHIFKAGVDFRRIRSNDLQTGFNGRYYLSANQTADPATSGSGHPMASLLLGQVDRFENDPNRGRFYQRSSYVGTFFQDDFKLSPSFTLNMGVRYDVEQQPNEIRWNGSNFNLVTGKVVTMRELGRNRIQNTDWTNFGPRFGFAWRPFGQSTVIRSHYGLFYTPLTGRATSAFNRFPQSQLVTKTSDGIRPSVVIAQTPSSVGSADGKGLEHYYAWEEAPVAYFQQWNFDIQREVRGLLMQATYAANVGRHLNANQQWNEIPIDVVRAAGGSSQAMRPYPDYTDIGYFLERQNSSYHSLQLSAEKRYSQGLSFLMSYTLSKFIDEQEDNFSSLFPMTSYNTRLEKGLSQAHIPHRFVTSAVYDLPFGKSRTYLQSGPAAWILGGWQMSGILSLQSGEQVFISQATNTARTYSRSFRPNLISSPVLDTGARTLARWFNTDAFQAPPPLTLGTSNKTPNIQGPGFAGVDLGLHRSIAVPIRESMRVELRGECFNCFNRVNFGLPSGAFATANFGRVTSAGAARTLQVAMKFWF